MRPELGKLLDHLTTMVFDLSPSTVDELVDRIRELPRASKAHSLTSWAGTQRSRDMVNTLIRLWRDVPEVDPGSLSFALVSALRTASAMARLQSIDLTLTGPTTNAVPMRRTDQALYEVIETSTKELLVVSFVAYKVPRVVEALERAVDRGVDVKIVLEVAEESGGKVSFDTLDSMERAVPGAKVYYWPIDERRKDTEGKYGSLHAKCAVADGEFAFVSSANLTEYALELNMELGVLVRGGNVPKRIASHFQELMARRILVKADG